MRAFDIFIIVGVMLIEVHIHQNQNTIFGWIVTGCPSQGSEQRSIFAGSTIMSCPEEQPWHEKVVGLMHRFWPLEEIQEVTRLSQDNLTCEDICEPSIPHRDGTICCTFTRKAKHRLRSRQQLNRCKTCPIYSTQPNET